MRLLDAECSRTSTSRIYRVTVMSVSLGFSIWKMCCWGHYNICAALRAEQGTWLGVRPRQAQRGLTLRAGHRWSSPAAWQTLLAVWACSCQGWPGLRWAALPWGCLQKESWEEGGGGRRGWEGGGESPSDSDSGLQASGEGRGGVTAGTGRPQGCLQSEE